MEAERISSFPKEFELLLACLNNSPSLSQLVTGEELDWDSFLRLAEHHRVYPLVYRCLKEHPREIPGAVLEQLKIKRIRYTFVDENLRSRLKEIIEVLTANGIKFCLLKGPVLGEALYGDSAMRPSKDLDILVEQKDLMPAIRILEVLGFEALGPDIREKLKEPGGGGNLRALTTRKHHIEFHDGKVILELHWRLKSSKYQAFDEDDTKSMLGDAVIRDFEGREIYTLKPEDEFVYLVIHGSIHYWFRLRWLMDIVLYLEKYPDLNFNSIIEKFKDYHMLNSFGQTLLLISRLFGDERLQGLEGIFRLEAVTFGGRALYRSTLHFLLSTADMQEYEPYSGGYYRKIRYVFWLLEDNSRRFKFLKYQLFPERSGVSL